MSYPNDPLESPWRYDGTYQARHLALLDLIRIATQSGGDFESKTSILNSSDVPIPAAGTFTGLADLNGYPDVMLNVKTDQNGTLYAEFSIDGINWDTSLTFKYDTARINPPHILVKGARYFRARFVNTSASAQTYFRLQTSYGAFNKLTAPLNGILSENYDAIATRPTDYFHEVAMGGRQGRTTWNKYGYNPNINSGATELIWSHSNGWTRLTTASTLSIVSTSAQDAVGGTGSSSVLVYGMDADFNDCFEIVTLTGTTPAVTSLTYLGVNRLAVYQSGTNESNVGVITAASGASVQAEIPAGTGSTQQAFFFVPFNHTALIDWMFINVNKTAGGSSPKITIKGWTYSYITNSRYEVFRDIIDVAVENHLELKPKHPFVVTGKQIFWLEATTDTNGSAVAARFSLILERNS